MARAEKIRMAAALAVSYVEGYGKSFMVFLAAIAASVVLTLPLYFAGIDIKQLGRRLIRRHDPKAPQA